MPQVTKIKYHYPPIQTSIVFTLDEGPGVLFKALAVFASRDINLTKVYYSKSAYSLFHYLFYENPGDKPYSMSFKCQIESRPQRKKPLRVVDDSNTGNAKLVLFCHLTE